MGETKYRVECWNCGGSGEIEGECTCWEDCCCCLEPEPPRCSHCRGRGYLIVSELTDDNCKSAIPIPAAVGGDRG
jgi:hypothetical protein